MPAPVLDMLAHYRGLLEDNGYDWGHDFLPPIRVLWQFAHACDPERWQEAVNQASDATPEAAIAAVIDCLVTPLPPGIAVSRDGGLEIGARLPLVIAERPIRYQVLALGHDGPPSVHEETVTHSTPELIFAGHRVPAAEPVPSGLLRLVADDVSRWSVVDSRGGAWYPASSLERSDWDGRPYFHGNDILLAVPQDSMTVTVARGAEFRPVTVELAVTGVGEQVLHLAPVRLYDAAARGWFGADLHVHLNYSGDDVCEPHDAALIQRGEGLHLMNLVAANAATALIYDRELLETSAGSDLPCSTPGAIARAGVEFRNDLFGHFHALGVTAAPSRYNSGHRRSDSPYHWPPNSVAARELRGLGGTIGYTHPVFVAPDGGDLSTQVFDEARVLKSPEAREIVADVALGLVDSVDLMMGNVHGTQHLYHRLLGCGFRLAVTAGSDAMLSHLRGRFQSNPPGWCRVYADLRGQALSVEAWQSAVRARRTFVTTGPWIELQVDDAAPGDTLAVGGPATVQVRAMVRGDGVDTLSIVGPTGVLAERAVASGPETADLVIDVGIVESTWLAAIGTGGEHDTFVGPQPLVYAHTSPVWVEVAEAPVCRPDDVAWCLAWLGRFEDMVHRHGNFADPGQLLDLEDLVLRARAVYVGLAAGSS